MAQPNKGEKVGTSSVKKDESQDIAMTTNTNTKANQNSNDTSYEKENTDEIGEWLQSIGLSQYRPVFKSMEFDLLSDLRGVTADELKSSLKEEFKHADYGFVLKGGHLGKFGTAIDHLRSTRHATQVVRRNESLNSQENDRVRNLEDKMKDFDDRIDKIKKDGRTTRDLMGIYRLDASKAYSNYTEAFDWTTVGVFLGSIGLIIRACVSAPEDARCFILVALGIVNIILLYSIQTKADSADLARLNRARGIFLSLCIGLFTFFEIGTIKDGLVITIICYVIAALLPLIDIYFKVKSILQRVKAHRIVMGQLESKMREGFEHEKSVKAVKKSSKESSHHSLAAPSHGSSEQKLSRNKSDPSLVSGNGSNVVTIPLAPVNE